jgi:hypothetical protein
MDEGTRKIVDCVKKNYTLKLDVTKYHQLELCSLHPRSAFAMFLVENRVKVFLRLHLLNRYAKERCWYAGNLKKYSTLDDEYSEDIGPACLSRTVEGIELFEQELRCLRLDALILNPSLDSGAGWITNKLHVKSHGPIFLSITDPLTTLEYKGGYVIITDDFVFSPKELFSEIESMIRFHGKLLEDFVKEQEKSVFIDHDVYISWLLKWFPNNIHVRSLK